MLAARVHVQVASKYHHEAAQVVQQHASCRRLLHTTLTGFVGHRGASRGSTIMHKLIESAIRGQARQDASGDLS